MSIPEISVIVPVYKTNKEYMSECVKSIMAQNVDGVEIILVDDGSPDDSGEYCDKLASENNSIKVIHKINGGSSSARNEGIKCASGKWIAFVDSDDWIEEGSYRGAADMGEKNNADVVVFSGVKNFDGRIENNPLPYKDGEIFSSYAERESLQLSVLSVASQKLPPSISLISCCGKLYRTSFLHQKGLLFPTGIRYNEDALFSLSVLENAEKVCCFQKSCYHYRCTLDGKTHSYRKNAEEEQKAFLNALWKFFEENKKDEAFLNAMYLRVLVSIQFCMFQKYYHKDSTMKSAEKRRAMKALLSCEPYKTAMENIKFKSLKTSFKVKFFFYKTGLFPLLAMIKNFYSKYVTKDS